MDFWFIFEYIFKSIHKLLMFKFVFGSFSFTLLSVCIGSVLLGLIFFGVGRLLK